MLRKSITIILLALSVAALSSAALAQNTTWTGAQAESQTHEGATAVCEVTFSTGSSTNATQFCVTNNGNIAQLSVAGNEMIAVGRIGEGYGICDNSTNGEYFDYSYVNSNNFVAPIFTHSGNVVTITRETNDSRWQLKQTITNIPATASGPGSVKVSMTLKNLSSDSRAAYVIRYVDVNADGDQTGNDFDFTEQAAFGLEPHEGRGLSSSNNTFNINFGQDTFAQNTPDAPHPCSPFGNFASQPFHGDGSIVQFWSFPAGGHNSSHTVVTTYRPI